VLVKPHTLSLHIPLQTQQESSSSTTTYQLYVQNSNYPWKKQLGTCIPRLGLHQENWINLLGRGNKELKSKNP